MRFSWTSRAARSARFSLNGFQLRCAGPEPVNPTMSISTGNRAPGPRLRRSYCGGSQTASRRTLGSPSGLSASTRERCSSITIVPAPATGRLRAMQCFLRLVAVADLDEREELAAGPGIAAEGAEHLAGDHRHAALVHATGGHAFVDRLDHDADPTRLQHRVDALGDFRGHLLLDLEAAGIRVDDARELADADDLAGRQITDVRPADDRRHVVLAVGLELDVTEHDHLVVTRRFLEGAPQVFARIGSVSAVPVAERGDDAARRITQTLTRRVLARPAQQNPHRFLGAFLVDGATGCFFGSSHVRHLSA